MKRNTHARFSLVTALAFLCGTAAAQTDFIIQDFTGYPNPTPTLNSGALLADSSGNLYGAGVNDIFELVKPTPPATKWTLKTIFSFDGHDGLYPTGPLVADSAGNLYGTTQYGGDHSLGTVFELTPNSNGTWTETVLHSFAGASTGDGRRPITGVSMDKNGNLYGATHEGANNSLPYGNPLLFQLVPPSTMGGTWTENVVYVFPSANNLLLSAPAIGDDGSLYVTVPTGGVNVAGSIFKLTPKSGGGWAKQTLYIFGPKGAGELSNPIGVTLYGGNLYGLALGGNILADGLPAGGVFELVRPTSGTTWTYSALYGFGATSTDGVYPNDLPMFDRSGNMFGTTQWGGGNNPSPACTDYTGGSGNGCGTVWELSPGASGWTETVLHAFPTNAKDGLRPANGLVREPNGVLYGLTLSGPSGTTGTAYGLNLR